MFIISMNPAVFFHFILVYFIREKKTLSQLHTPHSASSLFWHRRTGTFDTPVTRDMSKKKSKAVPLQARVAQRVPGS